MSERFIFHIDVNNAFLSWTAVYLLNNGFNKDIRKVPSVIGGDEHSRHGIVLAKSPVAKKLGVVSAEPVYMAKKKCPDLEVYPPQYKYYYEKSRELMEYLSQYSPLLEQYSVDECFLDMSGMTYIYKDLEKLAYHIKDEVKEKFGYTVNVGIGNNKLCAKMASDFEKPNKVHTLYKSEIEEKMWPLDVSKLFMAGKSSCKKLRSLGINTIYDLAHYDKNILIRKMKSQGKMLYEYANGIDDSKVKKESYDKRKSIGFSKTLEFDTNNKIIIHDMLREFSNKISSKLKEKEIYANTITITIRNDDFKTINHQEKLENSTNSSETIYLNSINLLKKVLDDENIRLIGLTVSDFTKTNNYQLSLFSNYEQNNKETEKLIDKLNKKLGENVIKKGSNLKK